MNTTTTKQLDLVSGEIVFWNATMSDRDALIRVTAATLGKGHAKWPAMTARVALKKAMKEHFPASGGWLIRPSSGGNLAAVKESQSGLGNTYDQQFIFTIDDDWSVKHVSHHPVDSTTPRKQLAGEEADELTATVVKFKDKVSGAKIGRVLGQVVRNSLQGVSLRQQGGAYFIPSANLDTWNEFSELVNQETGNSIYRVQCGVDDNTAAAIIDNCRESIVEQYESVLNELTEHDNRKPIGGTDGKGHAKWQQEQKSIQKRLDSIKSTAETIQEAFANTNPILETLLEDAECLETLNILGFLTTS